MASGLRRAIDAKPIGLSGHPERAENQRIKIKDNTLIEILRLGLSLPTPLIVVPFLFRGAYWNAVNREESSEIGPMPSSPTAQVVVDVIKAAVSAAPVVGGPAAALLDIVTAPALGRRRDVWLRRFGEAFDEFQQRLDGFDPRTLGDNEVFVSTVIQATVIALKTHREEKLKALQYAVVNSLLPGAPDEYDQMTFLRYVDELTPLHLRTLSFLASAEPSIEKQQLIGVNIDRGPRPEWGVPELHGHPERADQVMSDLVARGLLTLSEGPGLDERTHVISRQTTDFGDSFLLFIGGTEPAGRTLVEPAVGLAEWAVEHNPGIDRSQRAYDARYNK